MIYKLYQIIVLRSTLHQNNLTHFCQLEEVSSGIGVGLGDKSGVGKRIIISPSLPILSFSRACFSIYFWLSAWANSRFKSSCFFCSSATLILDSLIIFNLSVNFIQEETALTKKNRTIA